MVPDKEVDITLRPVGLLNGELSRRLPLGTTLKIPCTFIFILFFLLGLLLARSIPLELQARPYISLVVFAIFLAWARRYFIPKVSKIV